MSLRYFVYDLQAITKSKSVLVNLKWFFFSHTLHLLFLIRIGQDLRRLPIIGKLLGFFAEYIIRVLYSSDISCRAQIGLGFSIVHGHDIVIGSDVSIGCNCKIFNGVTLGNKDISKTSFGNQPTVGDNVVMSTGAKILGPIVIGDNVIIGANSVLLKSVPANVVVAGVPAKVLKHIDGRRK